MPGGPPRVHRGTSHDVPRSVLSTSKRDPAG
jgi:hypothetical protein